MSFGRNTVTVEPIKSTSAPGGVKWQVIVNGTPSTTHNYKDAATKKARQKARANSAALEVLDTNFNITERKNY
jgi:hypothetical protein